jgi:hypothetical protein
MEPCGVSSVNAARAFRIRGATVVAWQEGATRVLCRLTASEDQEAQEAIRRGDGERVADICKGAKRITMAIEHERQALEWQEASGSEEGIQQETPSEKKRGTQRAKDWIAALGREALKREAERMRRMKDEEQKRQEVEEVEFRRAFDEEAEKLFPRRRQNEMTKRIVMNRERFEGMRNRERFEGVTEARNRGTRPQASWKVQGESSASWLGLVE